VEQNPFTAEHARERRVFLDSLRALCVLSGKSSGKDHLWERQEVQADKIEGLFI
jgi:hypothetical protein